MFSMMSVVRLGQNLTRNNFDTGDFVVTSKCELEYFRRLRGAREEESSKFYE